MSLRRSGRVQAKPLHEPAMANGHIEEAQAPPKRRSRKSKASEATAAGAVSQDASGDTAHMPPPQTTPNKRRRVTKGDVKPPPITPTPSAVKLMTSTSILRPNWSSGDITDDTPPPEDRPAEPHHTNATLITPAGTQVPDSFWDGTPSKPHDGATTTKCLLDDAKAHLLKADPKLKTVIDDHPCKVFSPEGLAEEIDPFRSLTSGIIGQQVSGAAAKSIRNKFIALFEPQHCPAGFPVPAIVCETPLPRLREAGLSQRKAEYIQGLALKFHNGELSASLLLNGSDEEVMERLVAVRGLGIWSVEMFMCFGLKRTDVFSVGDLGVQRGIAAYLGRDVAKLRNKGGKWKYVTEKEMLSTSERFRPYRSLFMWYMWRYSDTDVAAVASSRPVDT